MSQRLHESHSAAAQPSIVLSDSVSCNLCGHPEQQIVLRGPDRMHRLPGRFTLVRCTRCGLIYQSPRVAPDAIGQLYPATYEPFQSSVADQGYIPRDIARTAALVNDLRPGGGTLLDVGCGAGDFLVTMRRLFPAWRLRGVEPNPAAAARAAERGLAVLTGSLEDVPPGSSQPDVVTLWNVLEHLADPLAFLREIERRLAPGGALCLAVPVNDSWEARLFGPYWVGWELPRHLYAFDRQSVTRLLQAAGFTVIRQECVSGTYHGLVRSLMLALEDRIRSYGALRISERVLLSRPLRAVFKPYTLLAERARRGTVLTLAARRTNEVAR